MTIDEHVTLNLTALVEYLAVWVSKGPYRYFQVYRDHVAIIVSTRVDGFSHEISFDYSEMRNKEHVMRQVAFVVGAVQGQHEMRKIRDQISDVKRRAEREKERAESVSDGQD